MSAGAAVAAPLWRPGGGLEPLVARLARGGLLAIPTESSYGLAADPRDERGVETVYRLKGRERGKPLPVVAADRTQILALGVAPDEPALAWAEERWPAALSVLLPLAAPLAATAGERAVAVRIPDHALLRALLWALGRALTATSANPSGAPPYLDAAEVALWLGAADADAIVVDGGRLAGGAPSTLVAWRPAGIEILRRGRVEP